MMRFRFLAVFLLLFHLSIPLVSCTSPQGGDDEFDNGAIEDSDINGQDGPTESPVAEGDEAPADEFGSDDVSEKELSDSDFDDATVAKNEEAPADGPADSLGDELPAADDQAVAQGDEDLDSEFDNFDDSTVAKDDSAADEFSDDELDEPTDKLSDGTADQAEPLDDLSQPPVDKPSTDQAATALPEDDFSDELPPAEDAPLSTAAEKIKIRDIRYLTNSSGGTVVIESSQPVKYQTRLNAATQQFVIEIAGVELPQALQRPYPTKDFNSRIGSINAYQAAGSDTARVVIQLNGKLESDPVVQQEGTSLVVIPPPIAPPPVAQAAPKPKVNEANVGNAGSLQARTLDEFLTGNQKFYGRRISLQVKDADVRDIVNFLAEESGANVVMSDDVKGKISLKLRRVPWDQALVTVMRTKELGYVRQGNVLRISTLKSLQSETEAANKIIEAGKALVPAVVQVIPVSYAAMEEISKNLTPFLSKDGKIVADQRTNTLIVTDKAEVVERVQKIVKTLDIPPAQVSIESKIVEAAEEFETFMGINWGFNGADVPLSTTGGAQGAPVNLNMQARSTGASKDFSGAQAFSTTLGIGTLDIFGDLTATLSLAEHDSLAKVISAPRISSMNREKSTIRQQGENVSVITTRSEQSGAVTKSEKRTPFSLELNVTPQITSDGSVIMDLEVKREFLGAVVDAETAARPVNTRYAKTKVLVHNGQTAVIGGIYTSDELEASTGIPGLMHIPILGWLFKSKTTSRTKNELLIFLTPRILAQQDEERLQAQQ